MVRGHCVADDFPTMHISRTAVPGNGIVVHHMTTDNGDRLSILVDADGTRHLCADDADGFNAPAWEIVLSPDEAVQLAEVLRYRPSREGP